MIFITKSNEPFVAVLNAILEMPFIRNQIANHDCRQECFVCLIKNALMRNQKIDFAEVSQSFCAGFQDLKGLRESFLFILEKLEIDQKMCLRVDYACGMFFGVCLNGAVLLACDFLSSIDMFFTEYLQLRSYKALLANSLLVKKADLAFECMISRFITNSNELNVELTPNCCVNPQISFESSAPINFFYFEIDWEDTKVNTYKILQILVGLSGYIELNSSYLYFNCLLLEHKNKGWLNVWRTSEGLWQLEGKVAKVSYTWLETVIFLAFSEYVPKFVIYESTPMANMSLSKDEIIKLEKLNSGKLSNSCLHVIEKIMHFTPVGRCERKCEYCRNPKFEGEPCNICKYNEGSWICENQHENIFTSFSCDVCNASRCFIQTYNFTCNKCNSKTSNQLFCSQCPICVCQSCDRIIFPGQTIYYYVTGTYLVSYKSSYKEVTCVDCSKYNNYLYE